jgi:hypothetical protein
VIHSLQRYLLVTVEEASKFLASLKIPLNDVYLFSCAHGKQLMQSWIQGDDRPAVFQTFLTGQRYPSELREQVNEESSSRHTEVRLFVSSGG